MLFPLVPQVRLSSSWEVLARRQLRVLRMCLCATANRAASSQQQELAAMRLQLQAIKAAALAQLSPSSSPRAVQDASAAATQSAAGGGAGAAAADDAPDLRNSDQQRDGACRD